MSSELIWEMEFLTLVMKKKRNMEHNENNTQHCYFNQRASVRAGKGNWLTVSRSSSQKKGPKSKLKGKMCVSFHYEFICLFN